MIGRILLFQLKVFLHNKFELILKKFVKFELERSLTFIRLCSKISVKKVFISSLSYLLSIQAKRFFIDW
jgi:hypothetical protein